MDIGSVRLGITVAERLRRNRKITITTSAKVSRSVNCTSLADCSMIVLLSRKTPSSTEVGNLSRNIGSRFRTARATATVLVPGCRWIARMIDR